MENCYNPCQQKIDQNFSTKAIHGAQNPDQWSTNDIVPPISLTTTYKQFGPNIHSGFAYSRCDNPTRKVLQDCIATLDGGKHCLTYASGLGAAAAVMNLLKVGDHVLRSDDMYGGTTDLLEDFSSEFGIKLTAVDFTNEKNVKKMILPETKIVWLESFTNPLMKVANLEAIATFVHNIRNNIIVVVDNTFQTSYFQKPLDTGIDVVHYSLSKYMNGHSDVIMGALVTNDTEIYNRLTRIQSTHGAVPSAMDCFLVNRGLKTLHLRMREHMKNGMAAARFLEQHSRVEKVLHPGLPSHPQHAVATRQCSGFGGMLSFYIKGGVEEAKRFLRALKMIYLASSLGGVESMASIPALMSHSNIPAEQRMALKITDNLIRLSIGLESEEDIINDLDQALQASIKE